MAINHIERYPANASQEYKDARAALLKAEYDLVNQQERVAEMRRKLPPGAAMKEYTFDEGPRDLSQDGPLTKTTLADLAADGRPVMVFHLMFDKDADTGCGMCAASIDGLNGVGKHLDQHVNFVIIGRGDIRKIRAWARKREWKNVRLLSSLNNTFNDDMHLENPPWMPNMNQVPSISVFQKDKDGVVRHTYTANAHFDKGPNDKEFPQRGTDFSDPLWLMLDITPEGRKEDWYADNSYMEA